MLMQLQSFWENVAANMVASAITTSTFWLVVLLAGCVVWSLIKRHRSRQLQRELEGLLKMANDAIHDLMNALTATHHDMATVQRQFNKWDSDTRDKLEDLRRKGICSPWQVDHFKVLGTYAPVEGITQEHARLRGMIAEKAKRLKDIAKELDARSEHLWPFSAL